MPDLTPPTADELNAFAERAKQLSARVKLLPYDADELLFQTVVAEAERELDFIAASLTAIAIVVRRAAQPDA